MAINYRPLEWSTSYTSFITSPMGFNYYHYDARGNVIVTVPHVLNAGSLIFIAQGKTWSVGSDNPNFALLIRLIQEGIMDEDRLVSLTSTKQLVLQVGGDRLKVENGTLLLDGVAMPNAWYRILFDKPDLAHVLLIRKGDSVRIEGDEDAPDGTYAVSDLDDTDPDQRVYIEGDTFFGFPKTSSIKEIIHAPS